MNNSDIKIIVFCLFLFVFIASIPAYFELLYPSKDLECQVSFDT